MRIYSNPSNILPKIHQNLIKPHEDDAKYKLYKIFLEFRLTNS
jgi:hypothetical protein